MRKEKFCKPYFSKRKHNVGCTQKNRLNGTVLLSSEYPSSRTITLFVSFIMVKLEWDRTKNPFLGLILGL